MTETNPDQKPSADGLSRGLTGRAEVAGPAAELRDLHGGTATKADVTVIHIGVGAAPGMPFRHRELVAINGDDAVVLHALLEHAADCQPKRVQLLWAAAATWP